MDSLSLVTDKFDATKPHARITVLRDGVSVLGRVRNKGDILLVNYGSPTWESTVDTEGNSYFTIDRLFSLERVDPPQDKTKANVVEVPEDVVEEVAEKAAEIVEEHEQQAAPEPVEVDAFEIAEDEVKPKPTTPRTRRTNKTTK